MSSRTAARCTTERDAGLLVTARTAEVMTRYREREGEPITRLWRGWSFAASTPAANRPTSSDIPGCLENPAALVEVGRFCGCSTVVLGSTMKARVITGNCRRATFLG
jgi:hypothetical protein